MVKPLEKPELLIKVLVKQLKMEQKKNKEAF